jgi:quercetin dioxygenase-like cupin family protein
MEKIMNNNVMYTNEANMLERSRWYGPNLVTLLTLSEETGGAFSLVKTVLRKGFEPPLHIHSREEESTYILDGEIIFEVGEQIIHAKKGDFIHLPRFVPHTFRLVTETASTLLLITPGGFEEMFLRCSRPALAMELPPVPNGKPGPEFFELLKQANYELGITMLPNL